MTKVFNKYKLYKHRKGLDVAISPYRSTRQENGDLLLQICWYNIHSFRNGWGTPVPIGCYQEIVIKKEDIEKWIEIYNFKGE